MKKIKVIIITLLGLIILPSMVHAASGKINVTSTSTIVVGNKVTVTVKLSAGASWEMNLNYDKKFLQLVSATSEAGGTRMVNTSTGKPNRTYTFTFKTLKTGSTTVKVGSYYVVDDNFETVSITNNSKTIKIITQAELEASFSKDNNLKNLSVEGYELNEKFSKDILNYTLNVPEGTTSIKINATKNDNKASVSGGGEITISEGLNTIPITVTAENGSEKTYTLVVNVIDQNPINVEVDGTKYTVIKLRKNYTCPELYEEKEIDINGFKVPACYNENINYTLVGLKTEEGTVEHFIYDNGKYTKYSELIGTHLKLIVIDYDKEVDGLTRYKEKINEKEYDVFKFSKTSNFYIIYGMNVETGEKNLYTFDSKNKTFILYDVEHINYLKDLNKTYQIVVLTFGLGLFLSLICIISLTKSKNKLKKLYKKQHEKHVEKKENLKEEKVVNKKVKVKENQKNNKENNKKEE